MSTEFEQTADEQVKIARRLIPRLIEARHKWRMNMLNGVKFPKNLGQTFKRSYPRIKPVEFSIHRTCRKAGGIFIGLRYSFPATIWDLEHGIICESRTLSVGLIFWQVSLNIRTQIQERP